jgi:hypothetical protein
MNEISDPFVGVLQQTSYYLEGTQFPTGALGALAQKVDCIAYRCLRPLEKGLFLYFKSKQVQAFGDDGLLKKTCRLLQNIEALAWITLGFPLAIIGKALSMSLQSLKKDFIWEGPKEISSHPLKKQEFHLLSFNVAAVPDWLAARNHVTPISKRASCIADALEKNCQGTMPDVMCFQEMFEKQASESLAQDLKAKGYTSIIRDVGSSHLYLNSGLFLASKYPLSNVVFYPHPVKGGVEKQANKGLLIATVHRGDKRLVVGTTHLNGGAEKGGYLYRAAQLKAINAHMDRYVKERLSEGTAIDGAFLSADTNIAPVDMHKENMIFEFEWYLQQLILNPEDAQKYLNISANNLSQKTALESLKILEHVVPKKEKVRDPLAWEEFFFHVKKINEANFFEVKGDLEVFLQEHMPKKLGGPMPVQQWQHDVDSFEKALEGSSLDMEASLVYRKNIVEPKRLDYNFFRTECGFEDQQLFSCPTHRSTEVLALEGLSDHYPVFSHFTFKNS